MYKSPIELIITDIQHQVTEKCEEACYEVVMHYIPNVDRAELLKALEYDRDQYEKGYRDGKRAAMDELVRCKNCKWYRRDCEVDMCWCKRWRVELLIHEENFCSYGERRTE